MSYWVIVLFIACNNPAAENKIDKSYETKAGKDELNIVLAKALDQQAKNSITAVFVDYDQYFRSPKKYLGFSLLHLLDTTWKNAGFDTTGAMILFECNDGYNPIMDLSKVYGPVAGFVVFKDIDQPDNKDWPDSLTQKFTPYYLVWDKVRKDDKSFFWPYGLNSIKLISQRVKWSSIAPAINNPAQQGYITFRDNCMKCHSINKIGGTFGPEFNIPQNITEYRTEEQIISFAKAPASYRYNSRMPAMNGLSDKEFENLILYLKYIKDHKNNH